MRVEGLGVDPERMAWPSGEEQSEVTYDSVAYSFCALFERTMPTWVYIKRELNSNLQAMKITAQHVLY